MLKRANIFHMSSTLLPIVTCFPHVPRAPLSLHVVEHYSHVVKCSSHVMTCCSYVVTCGKREIHVFFL